jgi:hypothetical protein
MADINQKHGKHVKSRPSDKDLTEADIIPASTDVPKLSYVEKSALHVTVL